MHPAHRPSREEPSSPLVDEPGSLPVEPDEGLVVPGEPPADAEGDGAGSIDIPQ